jgi:hypothetical protein
VKRSPRIVQTANRERTHNENQSQHQTLCLHGVPRRTQNINISK